MTRQEIIAEFTPDTIRTVSRRYVMRLFGVGYFIGLSIVGVCFFHLVLNRVDDWTTGVIGLSFVSGILLPLVLWLRTTRGGLDSLRRMSSPCVKLVFDDNGITFDSELGSGTIGWKSIAKIWEFPEAWFLFLGNNQHVTLPVSALTEELRIAIRIEVEKNR